MTEDYPVFVVFEWGEDGARDFVGAYRTKSIAKNQRNRLRNRGWQVDMFQVTEVSLIAD